MKPAIDKEVICTNPECKAHVSAKLTYCPHCGKLLPGKSGNELIEKSTLRHWTNCAVDLHDITEKEPEGRDFMDRIKKPNLVHEDISSVLNSSFVQKVKDMKEKADKYDTITLWAIFSILGLAIIAFLYLLYSLYDKQEKDTLQETKIEIVQDEKTGKYGIYNHTIDEQTIPFEYDSIRNVANDMSILYRNGMQGVCSQKDGKVIIPCENQYVFWEKEPTTWTWEVPFNYVGNIIPVKRSVNSGWDIYDNTGKRINATTYQGAWQTGLPNLIKVKYNSLYGIIDIKGKQIVACKAIRISRFREGKAFVEYAEKEDVVDSLGKVLTSFTQDYINHWHFSQGLFAKQDQDRKIRFYNEKGQSVFKYAFEQAKEGDTLINPSFDGDSARISYNGQNGYIFKNGTLKLIAE